MKKQTAVEYLLLTLYGLGFIEDIDDVFVQQIKNEAVQMEREQIISAYNQDLYGGLSGHRQYNDGEEYYQETYGK